MDLNKTHILIGASRLNLRTSGDRYHTNPGSRGARMFPTYNDGGPYGIERGPDGPVASMHLATAEESEYGSGAMVELVSDDPEWWEQVAREAAATAKALRELHADPRLTA